MTTLESTTNKKTVPLWQVVVYTFLGFVLVAALALIFRKAVDEPAVESGKVVKERLERLEKLRKEEHETVSTYTWADKAAGVVRIPVERAMALAVKELQAKPVQKSNLPVAPLVPAAAPAAAGEKK